MGDAKGIQMFGTRCEVQLGLATLHLVEGEAQLMHKGNFRTK